MANMEVFFDYSCPFCLRGHEFLKNTMGKYPNIQPVWKPCEAHPRPEKYGRHSDLTMQGMIFAVAQGADIWAYHERMYKAAVTDKADIEDPAVLGEYVADLLDKEAYIEALRSGQYAAEQSALNDYAYQQNGVWAVPSYRMDGHKLDSVEGVGITQAQLDAFMRQAK